MPRRTTEPSPNQIDMFVVNEQTGTLYPSEDVQAMAHDTDPMHDPSPGPSVDILLRNAHLQNMLKRLGVMSRTAGLDFISETGQRRELEERYDDVDRVVGNAVEKSGRKHQEAKTEYAKASGMTAMAGVLGKEAAKAMTRKSYYDEILPTFADAKGAKNRKAMQSWLNYQERTLSGKRTRRPKASLPKPSKVV